MTNQQIAAAYVAMCNGTKKVENIVGRNNLHIYQNYLSCTGVSLYSYSTPIAVYDGAKVVINQSFFSASTARHQAALSMKAFGCPVSVVVNFCCRGCSDGELLKQAAPLYSYQRRVLVATDGRKYTRFVLRKQASQTDTAVYDLHRYTSEQAARDEAARLNSLAYDCSAKS